MWNQYTYRAFFNPLGRGFGGEGPRAEGVGGGKPPPLQNGLTRPTEGRRIFIHFVLICIDGHAFFMDFHAFCMDLLGCSYNLHGFSYNLHEFA